jgi:uncharacterized OsmC-like protein
MADRQRPQLQPRSVRATYAGGDRIEMRVRGHVIQADQPLEDGGGDSAPTPSEIFVAGLAGCIAFYAERFLRRHHLPVEGLGVSCDYEWEEDPHRIGGISVTIDAPGLTEEKRTAFTRVVEHCTVHNTLLLPPQIAMQVLPTRSAVA